MPIYQSVHPFCVSTESVTLHFCLKGLTPADPASPAYPPTAPMQTPRIPSQYDEISEPRYAIPPPIPIRIIWIGERIFPSLIKIFLILLFEGDAKIQSFNQLTYFRENRRQLRTIHCLAVSECACQAHHVCAGRNGKTLRIFLSEK